MRLEGTLDAFSLPDIFQLLSFTKKTGALHLRRGDVHGTVHFNGGAIGGATSDRTRQALARRLVGMGYAGDELLEQAVQRAAGDPSTGVSVALVALGAVSEEQLRDALAEQVVDATFDLLRWPEGDFAFSVDEGNPDDFGVLMAVEDLVDEARRRLDYWQTVSRTVPSPDAVLVMSPQPPGELSLSPEEWLLLGLLDGRRSVRDVVALTGRGEFATVSAMATLVDRGMVVVRTAENDDTAATLARRQRILASLEGTPAAAAATPSGASAPRESAPRESAPRESVTVGASWGMRGETATANGTSPVNGSGSANGSRSANGSGSAHPDGPYASNGSSGSTPILPPEHRDVTPARTDFLPRRRPEHPDHSDLPREPMASSLAGSSPMGGGGRAGTAVVGSAAVAAEPAAAASPYIERDPSVNKSLLLRLIAGVRGL